jgi:hypothetical protein
VLPQARTVAVCADNHHPGAAPGPHLQPACVPGGVRRQPCGSGNKHTNERAREQKAWPGPSTSCWRCDLEWWSSKCHRAPGAPPATRGAAWACVSHSSMKSQIVIHGGELVCIERHRSRCTYYTDRSCTSIVVKFVDGARGHLNARAHHAGRRVFQDPRGTSDTPTRPWAENPA